MSKLRAAAGQGSGLNPIGLMMSCVSTVFPAQGMQCAKRCTCAFSCVCTLLCSLTSVIFYSFATLVGTVSKLRSRGFTFSLPPLWCLYAPPKSLNGSESESVGLIGYRDERPKIMDENGIAEFL